MRLRKLSSLSRTWACAAGMVLAAGCGGGVFVSIGGSGDTPCVSLVAHVRQAAPGDPVRLAAAALGCVGAAPRRIVEVIFFQLDDGSRSIQLGSDDSALFEWIAVVPGGASNPVRCVARAFDDLGRFDDSEVVTVNLR